MQRHQLLASTCSRSFCRTSAVSLRYDPRRGRDPDDGDYDVEYFEDYPNTDYNKPVDGNYTQDFSGDPKEGARLAGQKNFEGFPLAQRMGQWDMKHTPWPLRDKEFRGPVCEDRFGQRYPGYWINERSSVPFKLKQRFHYVKEMEPLLMVPDLTDFALKPYVSYRAEEIEQPALTAKALFNLVYADDIYKKFLAGHSLDQEEEKSVEEMTAEGEKARTEAEKTGSDRFVPNSWFGIEVDQFN